MTLRDWAQNVRERYLRLDARSATYLTAKETESRILLHPLNWWMSRYQPTKVFDEDWEVLIVLDTCRVDALELLSHEFDYLPRDVPWNYSAGQTSYLWMAENFGLEYAEEMARTAHITWNPHSKNELDASDWAALEEVWRDWPDLRYLPAAQMTDRAVEVHQEINPDRMVVHYMQPHEPYPGLDVNDDYDPDEILDEDASTETVFGLIKRGDLNVDVAWFYYLNSLRGVLKDIRRFVEATPYGDIVLTADHGESFGEYGFYGHPGSVKHPQTVRVPWIKLDREAVVDNDRGMGESVSDEEIAAQERLRQLGYVD